MKNKALFLMLPLALAACSEKTDAGTKANEAPAPASTAAPAAPAVVADVSQPPAGFPDRFLGEATAPVTVIEYASLGCIHCAHLNADVLPALKQKYIETGKVRWVYRDFPLERLSLTAAQLARCLPEQAFFPFIDLVFQNREKWLQQDGNLLPLRQMAGLAGMGKGQIDACLDNNALQQAILAERLRANTFKIESTPTLFVNGKKLDGAHTVESLSAAIDAALPK